MTKVLIQNGKVHEIFGASVPPLTPELMAQIAEAPGNVEEGWDYDGLTFTPPPPPPPKSASPLTAEELATILVTKGTITDSEVLAIKVAR